MEKKRSLQLIAKLKEAMIKLLTLLGKCVEAVQLALQSEKISEALAIANRPSAADSKKEMWIEIAREMLEK